MMKAHGPAAGVCRRVGPGPFVTWGNHFMSSHRLLADKPAPRWPADPLRAITMFHSGKDPAHQSLRRLIKRLEKAKILHAVMGGMAVYAHGHRRLTDDVDILVTREGLEAFRREFVPRDYEPVPKRSRRFTDKTNGITIDFLVTGLFPGLGKPGPIAFPDPALVRQQIGKIQFIDRVNLIQLKLAARRHQDFADVVSLISIHNLDESFLDHLHPSVHQDFIECLEEKRREDEYEARNG
jgi:hypothetical protein